LILGKARRHSPRLIRDVGVVLTVLWNRCFISHFIPVFLVPSDPAAPRAFQPRAEAPKMMVEGVDSVAVSNVADNANMLASSVTDFGGYLFPVFGILSLCGLILFLAPPLVDE